MRIATVILVMPFLVASAAWGQARYDPSHTDSNGCPAIWDPSRGEWRWSTPSECQDYRNRLIKGEWFLVQVAYKEGPCISWGYYGCIAVSRLERDTVIKGGFPTYDACLAELASWTGNIACRHTLVQEF
jgi:hypothetical protein